MFETAPNASFDAPIEELQKFNVNELLADIQKFFAERCTAEKVKACFEAIDTAGTKKVDCEDFRWAMIDLGYQLSKMEADEVCACFGGDCLNYCDFMSKLCWEHLPKLLYLSTKDTQRLRFC